MAGVRPPARRPSTACGWSRCSDPPGDRARARLAGLGPERRWRARLWLPSQTESAVRGRNRRKGRPAGHRASSQGPPRLVDFRAGAHRGHSSESTASQPRPLPLRHVCRDRRRPGSGAVVLSGGRRGRHGRQGHVGLRHDLQRRHLRHERPLRQQTSHQRHARPRIRTAGRAPRQQARRRHEVLRVRRYGGGQELCPQGRPARLARRALPELAARAGVADHHARAVAGQGERPGTGGARPHRRESGARRQLPAPRPDGAGGVTARRSHERAGRSRHDRVLGP